MEPLLEVRDLSVSFPLGGGLLGLLAPSRPSRVDVAREVNFSVQAGETLGIVGESGSGKTTVIRALNGLIPRDTGTIVFDGEPISGSDRRWRSTRRNMAMLFQDPISSLSPRLTVGRLILEPFRVHGIRLDDREAKLDELLSMVGLSSETAEYYPHELSGGQARRVGIARGLALDPRLILADEPTAGLDVSVQGQVLNLLLRLQRESGVSYVVVTHDLAVVRHVAHKLAIMYLGHIVEYGATSDIFRAPRHPYTRLLLEAEPIPDPRRRRDVVALKGEIPSLMQRPAGCGFCTRCPFVRDRCRVEAPPPRDVGGGHIVRCHFPFSEPESSATDDAVSYPDPTSWSPVGRETSAAENKR